MNVININEKLDLFNDHWSPKVVASLNNSYVKLAKFQGEFIWHVHENEDELFYVVNGMLEIHLRDQLLTINTGECVVIPRGIEHKPVAKCEVSVILIELKATLNTGDKKDRHTVERLDWI